MIPTHGIDQEYIYIYIYLKKGKTGLETSYILQTNMIDRCYIRNNKLYDPYSAKIKIKKLYYP